MSVEVKRHQEEILQALEQKINRKKQEFEELASSQNATDGEKHDLQRALARIDRLIDIPKNSNLLKMFPKVFNSYVFDLIHNVLELDARNVNHLLACTPIGNNNAEEFDGFVQYNNTIPISNKDFEVKLAKSLPKWDNTNFFFYLSQLPIVVKGQGLPEYDRSKLKEVGASYKEKDSISEQDIEKLFEAALLIDKVEWLKSNPASLKGIESISVLESAPFKGLAAGGHAIIVIDEKATPLSLAETIIHEDDHHKNITRFHKICMDEFKTRKDENSPANLQHPWLGKRNDGLTSELLFELSAYGTATSFFLKVWDTEGRADLFKCLEIVEKFIPYKRDAKLAIKLAKENSNCLNEDGRQ